MVMGRCMSERKLRISFIGTAFSEPTLIRLASGFEHVTGARRRPQLRGTLALDGPSGAKAGASSVTRRALERRLDRLPLGVQRRLARFL